MSYIPKTDWQYNEVLTEQDMNRIEGGLASHLANQSNPHEVTAEQVGAETPTGAQAKVDAHADRTDNPHHVTAEQVGAVKAGEFDTDVNFLRAITAAIDTRSIEVTRDDITGKISTVIERSENTVVRTLAITRGEDGKIDSVTEHVGGKTITTAVQRDTARAMIGLNKTVE